ncbi:carboxypeptidase regulatory-like domain-containing protein [Chitinophaga pendula]|uniref:hypothetical protein n=1 Tax=Chitinophaga TaxID=79328 RepID=UPI000BAED5C4|nr:MULTISPECIES: hypothetical protein [Chitinophaga]ASZ10772.1 hypothetical protein CK934_07170 [Chitinophaga sp. MD30]UCJ06250.1 carboxypeptidase regulatory-like domain-containing protein [Chitinophaga pendula]
MNRIKVGLIALAAAAVGTFSFKGIENGSITGKVTPADAATEAWAIKGTDTLKTAVNDGAFSFQDAKNGTYTIVVDARDPFKDAVVNDVKVEDGKATDLGEIKLAQ